MLFIAGLIEGFFSPGNAPVAMKFALRRAVLWFLAYLFRLPGTAKHPVVTAGFAP